MWIRGISFVVCEVIYDGVVLSGRMQWLYYYVARMGTRGNGLVIEDSNI